MKTRPIIFSGPMVRALLDGSKTQTRRVVKPQPQMVTDRTTKVWDGPSHALQYQLERLGKGCPYGMPGDRLWVRETWGLHAYGDDTDWLKGGCTALDLEDSVIAYRADWGPIQESCHWRPSIHMPRWASRITLEITAVRVERLKDISVSDAMAEGYNGSTGDPVDPSIKWYAAIWESINGPGSWDANPWVWVVAFKRVEGSAT